jgi:uncharacterized protein
VKFHIDRPGPHNAVTGYGPDFVTINGERHEENLIVLPDRLLPWDVAGFDALAETDFGVFVDLGLEVLVLGTGARLRFPHPRLTRALAEKRIGVEAMDLQAACRTYNILVAEGRRVAAALLFK